jgi:hypothetical protein
VDGAAGKLVGTVLAVLPADAATDKRWWEGDWRCSADGRRTPGHHGTGHEDDYFGGWSNEFFDGPFTLPMNGEPRTEIADRNGQLNGNVTMYRLWTGIPFLDQLRHSVEHGTENAQTVDQWSTTFFYALSSSRLVDSDALDLCDDVARAAHTMQADGESAPAMLTSAFEGRAYRTPVSMCHRAHQGAASFTMAIFPENRGVLLRRAFDQTQGRQRARVSVDGDPVGDWYVAEGNAILRWAERDYFLPARFTAGKTAITIAIAPDPTAPAWDAAQYRTLSVTRP